MVTYEEAEALIQRSSLRPTDLISEADIRRAVIDMRWFGNLDPKFYNIFYMIRKEQVSIVNERVEREYLKNPFYLTPEELEKKALLWFKANHETVKQKVHPGWARQIHELENAYREAAAQQQATNQEGEDGFHRATDAWRAEQEEGQEVRDRRKDFEDSKHAQAGLEKRRYASLYDNASAEDEVYKARVRLDAARDAEEAERDERRREMPHGGGYEEWSKQNHPAGMAADQRLQSLREQLKQLGERCFDDEYKSVYEEVILAKDVLLLEDEQPKAVKPRTGAQAYG